MKMKERKLTPKQEAFCHAYIETGNASEAYRRCYSCGKMKPESINRKAFELLENVKITAMISDLQAELKKYLKNYNLLLYFLQFVIHNLLNFLKLDFFPLQPLYWFY